ncbi:hypothetical protein [Bradyrhizobium cosmicum]|uniref:hypothetical protein n=1 Tax=Bradyrhizobium cosmicum TaxID=1404864 RepID=UPI001164D20C|nr:hypothetical protein [Bradyrhizobium cosmicum]QDP20660.1 hypothetical protein FNV92_00175 [Bradyrhizobium cosmicum]QDP27010.1 hypothetical protein FNV92_34870 [Bradyrhizobium cosmicum]
MSISFPLTDLQTLVPIASQSFPLVSRQELSRLASGVTIGKDLGSALWMPEFSTDTIDNDDAVAYEARLNSLDGVVNIFTAGDLRRLYPRSHADGVFNDTGVLASVNANNKALALSGLDPSFALSIGDYLAFDYSGGRALHQVVEAVTANGSGTTAQFEVRPHIRPGFSLSAAVTLKKPKGYFMLVPGSVQASTNGPVSSVISFKAVQVLP